MQRPRGPRNTAPRGRGRGRGRVALARSTGQITQGLTDQSEEYESESKSFVQRRDITELV